MNGHSTSGRIRSVSDVPNPAEHGRQSRAYLWLVAVVAVLTAPFPFIGVEERAVLGLPMWLWWSLVMTAVLSAVTVGGILRYWKDAPGDGE